MAQVLSQDEVDALLNAVNEGDLEEESGSDSKQPVEYGEKIDENIQPYDLTNQDRVIRGRMPILESSMKGLFVPFASPFQIV